MKILAIVRQVPDAEENVKVVEGRVDLANNKLVLDTMDEYGIEEALRMRERTGDVEIVALAVGASRSEEALRTALALGADRAILVETADPLDVIAASAIVAQIAQTEFPDLIFCGGQQADWDSQGLGPAVAERLKWPQASWVTALTLEGNRLTGKHDVDEGTETFALTLPAVVTTQQGLNEPRYPTLPNIMKARKKELLRKSVTEFAAPPKVTVTGASIQIKERVRKILDGKDAPAAAAQLVDLLRNEAKVVA